MRVMVLTMPHTGTCIRPAHYKWAFKPVPDGVRCFPMDIDADSYRLLQFYRRGPDSGAMFGPEYGYQYDWDEIRHLFEEPAA